MYILPMIKGISRLKQLFSKANKSCLPYMDNAIEQAKEGHARRVAAALQADVPKKRHYCVVVEVQKGEVIVLLAQHKEDGVQQVEELGHPVPPGHAKLPQRLRTGVGSIGILPNEETTTVFTVIEKQAHKVGIA